MRHGGLSDDAGALGHSSIPANHRGRAGRALLSPDLAPCSGGAICLQACTASRLRPLPSAGPSVPPTVAMPFARSRPSRGRLPTRSHLQAIRGASDLLDAGQPFGRRYYWKVALFRRDRRRSHRCHGRACRTHRIATLCRSCHVSRRRPARMDPSTNAVGLRTASYVLNIQAAWESARGRPAAPGLGARVLDCHPAILHRQRLHQFHDGRRGRSAGARGLPCRRLCATPRCQKQVRPGNLFHGAQNIPAALEHDPEECAAVFGKGSCSNKRLERDNDSRKSSALAGRRAPPRISTGIAPDGAGVLEAWRFSLR